MDVELAGHELAGESRERGVSASLCAAHAVACCGLRDRTAIGAWIVPASVHEPHAPGKP